MTVLDDDARIAVERAIDELIEEPKETEDEVHLILIAQGIEPNLEAVLSYLTGMLFGLISGFYFSKYHRDLNQDEQNELIECLKEDLQN